MHVSLEVDLVLYSSEANGAGEKFNLLAAVTLVTVQVVAVLYLGVAPLAGVKVLGRHDHVLAAYVVPQCSLLGGAEVASVAVVHETGKTLVQHVTPYGGHGLVVLVAPLALVDQPGVAYRTEVLEVWLLEVYAALEAVLDHSFRNVCRF